MINNWRDLLCNIRVALECLIILFDFVTIFCSQRKVIFVEPIWKYNVSFRQNSRQKTQRSTGCQYLESRWNDKKTNLKSVLLYTRISDLWLCTVILIKQEIRVGLIVGLFIFQYFNTLIFNYHYILHLISKWPNKNKKKKTYYVRKIKSQRFWPFWKIHNFSCSLKFWTTRANIYCGICGPCNFFKTDSVLIIAVTSIRLQNRIAIANVIKMVPKSRYVRITLFQFSK